MELTNAGGVQLLAQEFPAHHKAVHGGDALDTWQARSLLVQALKLQFTGM